MRHARLLTTALLAAALSLSGCDRDRSLVGRYPGAGARILAGSGFVRASDGFVAAGSAEADPVRAAEASLAARGGLRLRLPADGSGAASLSLPGGFGLEIREHGLAGAAQIVGGALAYAREDGTSYWTATEAGYEEWLEVADATAAAVAEWEVRGAALRQSGDAVELLDASGIVRVRVSAPQAFEAGGTTRRAWLRASGGVVALFTDARGPALVDPSWTTAGSMSVGRTDHSATLLLTGKVLVAGGYAYPPGETLASAELYDPATGTWSATGSMSVARMRHTAVQLRNGKVLVASGQGAGTSAELYDPSTGTWTATGDATVSRFGHTATLLGSGQVLVAGGNGGEGVAELYDPGSGTWSATGALAAGRLGHTATLLRDGRVLVAGGYRVPGTTPCELYDPSTGTWSAAAALGLERWYHNATALNDGRVLVTGGATGSSTTTTYLASALLYDPASDTWTATGSMGTARFLLQSALLPSGKVLAVGGRGAASAELYDPSTGTWSSAGALPTGLEAHAVTILPSGSVLVVGGYGGSLPYLASSRVYDPTSGSWSGTGPLLNVRHHHTATLLPSGKVLVAGGRDDTAYVATAELYDPSSGSWSATGSLPGVRGGHAAVLLRDGTVLVVGGESAVGARLATAALYDPASGSWRSTASLSSARFLHTATLLPSGKVLVAGGYGGGALATAELYDPGAATWSPTGSLGASRYYHTATVLPSGKVLVAGGNSLATAELYDPAAGAFGPTGAMAEGRNGHTATLLPSGKVLVTAGAGRSSAELYDPEAGTWSSAGSLSHPRNGHTTTLLQTGKVLVAGGYDTAALADTELYDPVAGAWSAGATLATPRTLPTATLLPSGKVLLAGGGDGTALALADLYDEGLGATWAPTIATAPEWAQPGETVTLSGTLFTGPSQGSGGGYQSSAANHPLVELRNPETGSVAFLPASAFTETSIDLPLPASLALGRCWLTVIVSGIRSEARALRVNRPPTTTDGTASTPEDTSVQITLPGTDPDGDALTSTVTTPPAHGTLAGTGLEVTYTPEADWNGTDSFTFTVGDGTAVSAPATVTVTVQAVNDAPDAVPDAFTLDEDTPTTLDVLANDTDVEGDALTITSVTQPPHGTVTFTADSVRYTPAPDWSGADTFTYVVRDPTGALDTAPVSVTVNPVNDAPWIDLIADQTTPEDAPLAPIALTIGDVETPAGSLLVVATSSDPTVVPVSGLVFGGAGASRTLTVQPAMNASGTTTITVTVQDAGGAIANQSFLLTVTAVNDPPDAVPDAFTLDEDTPTTLDVLANDTDVEGDALTITSVTQPPHGTVTFTADSVRYTPAPDWSGADTFTYVVRDPTGALDTAPVSVTVNPVDDAPVAVDDPAGTDEDTALTIDVLVNDHDADGDVLTVTTVTQPVHGTVTFTATSVHYTPTSQWSGGDAFTYTVSDGNGGGATATVAITVTPVNDAPLAAPQSASTGEDASLQVTLAATDVDGDALTYAVVVQPTHGTVTLAGAVATYTPAGDYHGPDAFGFAASDGAAGSNVASISIDVAPVNDPPSAQPITASINEDGPAFILLTGSDVDGDALTFSVVMPPAHGTLSGSGANLTYTPAPDYNGPDAFTFKANDGSVDSSVVTVAFSIAPMNDAPVAEAQAVQLDEDGSVAVTLAATDVDGDALTYGVVVQPTHGAVTLAGATVTYTPEANYHGPDAFTFTANDGTVDAPSATVNVAVASVNDLPVAQAQSVATDEDVAVAITLAGSDVEGDALGYTVVTPPAHGTLTGTGATLTYTPSPDFNGDDAFTFTVNDGTADSAPATVIVAVAPVDDPVPSEPKGGCSCGSSGEVAPLGGLLLGLLAVRRRRRTS
jgi:MYXO-CTERM domain-containing protein